MKSATEKGRVAAAFRRDSHVGEGTIDEIAHSDQGWSSTAPVAPVAPTLPVLIAATARVAV